MHGDGRVAICLRSLALTASTCSCLLTRESDAMSFASRAGRTTSSKTSTGKSIRLVGRGGAVEEGDMVDTGAWLIFLTILLL